MKLGAKQVKLVHPDPPYWKLNPCIGAFRSVWVHLGSFHYCMKLGAKQAELVHIMQLFVPRSRSGIKPNEHTRFIPLDRKVMFWCVS
jgi:hypothetical protein